jgi:uncharacterized membrane protein
MKQWYCYVGGNQHGPVSEEVLKGWIREGRVARTDYVWADGMADWVPAGSVPALFEGVPGAPPVGGAVPSVPPPGGTGGATPNERLNAQARERLRGTWGIAIGFCLLYFLIQMAINSFPYVGGLAMLILAGPLELGWVVFFLTFGRGGRGQIGMLFAGFKNFGQALGAYLLRYVFVLLWFLAFVVPGAIAGVVVGALAGSPEPGLVVGLILGGIPGMVAAIVASLAYAQTFYLIADEPTLGALEAVRKSKRMMAGSKGKLFCLNLRYFCWGLLCLLTCGIGFLFLGPYMGTGFAHFYDDLRGPMGGTQPMPAYPVTPPSPEAVSVP